MCFYIDKIREIASDDNEFRKNQSIKPFLFAYYKYDK